MASEIRAYTLTVPANTPSTAPLVKSTSFPERRVDAISVIVPPGPSGQVGFCVLVGGVRVIPYDSDLWIVTAGESITWPLERQPTSGAWSVAGYNTGTNAHSVYFRFLLSLVPPPTVAGTTPIAEADLTPADYTLFAYPEG